MIDINGILNSLSSNLLIGDIFSGIWEDLLVMFISVSMWVLGLIKGIVTLIFDIAAIDFFGEDVIGELLNRVYIIIGVLMLFKITISCLQYLINPDKSEDKENGFGAIVKRTLISIALLALVPSIFNFAKAAQTQIVAVLPRVILGTESTINPEDIANDLSYSTALGFFGYSDESCNDGSIGGLAGASSSPEFNSIEDIIEKSDVIVKNNDCNGESRYRFNYLCFFAGVFLVFILISMALDVGIRTIKLGFLQLIAPIPIASYIDPKSSKKSFDSWVHNSVSVYADLFIRLGVIYLILYLFEIILGRFSGTYVVNGTNIGIVRSQLVNVAIIIALFMFAKSAPKFICDVLGIKAGEGGVADMFKRAGGFAATPLAALAAGVGGYRSKKQWGHKTSSSIVGGLRAAAAATGRGLYASSKGGKMSDVFKNSRDKAIAAANSRYEFKARGGNFGMRVSEGWDKFTGIQTGAQQVKQDKEFYQNVLSLKSNEKKNALAKVNALSGFVDSTLTISGSAQISANGHTYGSYADFLNELNGLQNISWDKLTATQKTRLNQLTTDKDAVEKFMIKNQTFIALTNPGKDEGNYSAIAADVIKIARSGSKEAVDKFLTNIGGGDGKVGATILDKLTNHLPLSRDEAIKLNDYIAGALEGDAQKGISNATARERTIPKS